MKRISVFANPYRFMKVSKPLIPVIGIVGLLCIIFSTWQGLFVVRPEQYQGDAARIMFVHVPMAWLAMAAYTLMALASFVWFVWRHETADLAAKSIAPLGALSTGLCLATGSIWGKPTWGTWFQWDDARLVSVLVMFFLYLGYMALRKSMDTHQRAARAGAILAMVGLINVPIIKFSVDIWSSLHQDASVLRLDGPAMPAEYLIPLLVGALGYSLVFGCLTLMLMRSEIYSRRTEALILQRLEVE